MAQNTVNAGERRARSSREALPAARLLIKINALDMACVSLPSLERDWALRGEMSVPFGCNPVGEGSRSLNDFQRGARAATEGGSVPWRAGRARFGMSRDGLCHGGLTGGMG